MLRLVTSNLRQRCMVSSLRFNSSESSKSAVQTGETAQAPTNIHAEAYSTPQQMTQMNPLYKYLVYKFSSTKYNSPKDVPDSLPSAQVNFAKDKGRASMTVILIGATILGAMVAIFMGKRDHKQGKKFTDDIVKQHSEYSKVHQEMLKNQSK